jgi:hypothetical protein
MAMSLPINKISSVLIFVRVCQLTIFWHIVLEKTVEHSSRLRCTDALYFLQVVTCLTLKVIPIAIPDLRFSLNDFTVPVALYPKQLIFKIAIPFPCAVNPVACKFGSIGKNGALAMPHSIEPSARIHFPSWVPANTLSMSPAFLYISLVLDFSIQPAPHLLA